MRITNTYYVVINKLLIGVSFYVIPESSRTLNDVRDLITLIVFTNKNCKYVFAVIYDGVWEDILGKA